MLVSPIKLEQLLSEKKLLENGDEDISISEDKAKRPRKTHV